ncbi:MAG: hypothetical protein ACAF41_12485 [Leptolyngbya sp. BL-A-14]
MDCLRLQQAVQSRSVLFGTVLLVADYGYREGHPEAGLWVVVVVAAIVLVQMALTARQNR